MPKIKKLTPGIIRCSAGAMKPIILDQEITEIQDFKKIYFLFDHLCPIAIICEKCNSEFDSLNGFISHRHLRGK